MSRTAKAVAGAADWTDARTGLAPAIRYLARKVFPDHWSFLLGEIALYSFLALVISGTFLTMFFVPSMDTVVYDGPYAPLQGQEMSAAYASTVYLSFEVRGGLLMRQIHHWAAVIFIAAAVVHLFRIFFTGAFRKPRELNWMVGFLLLVLAMLGGFSGYSLPDDVLSGNGLRIADGVTKSIPIVGSYLSYALFGGQFPGEALIPRLFTVHVLLIPGLILALVGVHLVLMVVHKHTQYPAPGRTDANVVGSRFYPRFMAKMGGYMFFVFAVIALMGATMTINPVWNYGPYDPSPVSAGAQPDWYILFMEGALRLMPGGAEFELWGFTFSLNVLIPAVVVPGILFGLLAAYPFWEAWVTGDKREHHVLDRPRNVPVRTALGVALISEFVVLALAGSNDLIATHLHMNLNNITWVLRVAFFAVPPIAFWATRRICLGMARRDRERVLHGEETGRMVRDERGRNFEIHQPLDDYARWPLVAFESPEPLAAPVGVDAAGVRRRIGRGQRLRVRASRFYFRDRVAPVTPAELAAETAHAALPGSDGAGPAGPSASGAAARETRLPVTGNEDEGGAPTGPAPSDAGPQEGPAGG